MEIDVIRQFGELMDNFGLKTIRLSARDADSGTFDRGLRNMLYEKMLGEQYDYKVGIQRMEKYFEANTLYMVKDMYESYYISFLIPGEMREREGKEFLHIGPYIMKDPETITEHLGRKEVIPLHLQNETKEYYYSVPLIKNDELFESIVMTLAGYIFGGKEKVRVTRYENVDVRKFYMRELTEEEEDPMTMAFVEERYRYEDMMLDAIRNGDLEKVLEAKKHFYTYRLQPRGEDSLRNAKNLMVIWNTLFRKAVQEADVHPMHIDKISTLFAKKIEACTHVNMLSELSQEMMHKYCLLVRNHSLRGYSQLVKDTLNYIDFNLKEQLSLKLLAEQVNANASYLSAQFKKETGKTVTDYINEKRIHNSLVLLATTDMPIQTVAEQVGIRDENYFSRLFKKYQNQTAKQYRSLMREK